MSTIADRQNVRVNASFPNRTGTRPESYFWIGLAVVAAALIVCAFAAAYVPVEAPLDVPFVGP